MEKTVFTKEMVGEYTILVPPMFPIHERLLLPLVSEWGYNMKMITNDGPSVMCKGLNFCHNDTCYPAQVCIGEMIDCIESGEYDPHKIAFLITQTGGGCRASNYISLMRKALDNAGYNFVPIISLNFKADLEKSAFKFTVPMLIRMGYFLLIGDLLMTLKNQIKPYETEKGAADAMVDKWIDEVIRRYPREKHMKYTDLIKCYREIIRDFKTIETKKPEKRTRVGIVGEIFVKFSPYGNNHLEDFLIEEGAEPVLGGVLDFILYCVSNGVTDARLYGTKKLKAFGCKILTKVLCEMQKGLRSVIGEESNFNPMPSFYNLMKARDNFISMGVKMGEGWLLTAEMLDFCEEGVNNIVCTQPFGCLPNHIIGKGMIKGVREKFPNSNIVAIDYDFSNTKANQENRLKLMLANAKA